MFVCAGWLVGWSGFSDGDNDTHSTVVDDETLDGYPHAIGVSVCVREFPYV